MSTDIPAIEVAGPARPRFLPDASNEMLWDVVLALSTELAATRGRLDALERVLAERGTVPSGTLDDWRPSPDAAVERAHDMRDYTQRVFGALAGR